MLRLLLFVAPALAACTPSPQKAAMPSPSQSGSAPDRAESNAPRATPAAAANTAARGPAPEPVSAAGVAAPGPIDSPAAAIGRRTFSTAFVMIGPDGHLTVELRDGRVLVLRDVVMNAKEFCGVQAGGGKFCGGYADVAAARPGGGA